jgi:hypothetical protein
MSEERGTLELTEPHPSALHALKWIRSLPATTIFTWQEAYASCSIEGNRLAEVCGETLRRLMDGEPVSDRYLLGLAWSMRYDGTGEVESTGKKKRGRPPGKKSRKAKDEGVAPTG